MGSPPSRVLPCIYLEFLEHDPFKYIIPNTARYLRYIDDILLVNPQDFDLHSISDRLNYVEHSIKFTYELESNSTLHFLDILLIRNIKNENSRFNVNTPVKTTSYILFPPQQHQKRDHHWFCFFLSPTSMYLFLEICK